jgi:hypothetical protein
MGLNEDWIKDVAKLLTLENLSVESIVQLNFKLLWLHDAKIMINLVPLHHDFSPEVLIDLQAGYHSDNIILIHLWEDVWIRRKQQVLSRLKSLTGVNKRIHGRATSVKKITKELAEKFLERYHLQGSAGGRYHFGLYKDDELLAVSSFSNKRTMKNRSAVHTSAELIRFATKEGYTVIGGMSKLIKHYVQIAKPNDLMSYADRDWSQGKAYLAAGFQLKAVTAPVRFYLDPQRLQRYSAKQLAERPIENEHSSYLEIFNTGNLKYVLEIQ